MLGTLILDNFRRSEAPDVRVALEDLLGPRSGSTWSSGGVYVFWAPEDREPLYVGISGDLPVRFAEHLGLRSAPAEGCRREQIAAYFDAGHEELGYTVFTMSSLSPVSTTRQRKSLGISERRLIELNEAVSAEAVDATRAFEGRLVAATLATFGQIPRWNTSPGRVPAKPPPPNTGMLRIAVGAVDILLQARHTIRELAADHEAAIFEEYLHGVRIQTLTLAGSDEPIDNDTFRSRLREDEAGPVRDRILANGYLDRRCPVTVGPSAEAPDREAARASRLMSRS